MQLQHYYFPKRSFVISGPWSAALTVTGRSVGTEKLSFSAAENFTARSLTLPLLLFCFCAPASTCAIKEAGSHFVILLCVCEVSVEATGKVCSYGESWRDSECLSQCLFAGLFHASQPGSAINPEYRDVPADPSPHRAPLLVTAVHSHAAQMAY